MNFVRKYIWVFAISFLVPEVLSSQTPVNPNASEATAEVLNYLHSVQGKGLLSGQENLATDVMYWTDLVAEKTGKYPALLGEDWSYGDEAYKKRLDIVNASVQYWDAGGLVTISWHQVNPDTWDGSINEGPFSDSQMKMSQDRFDELLTPGTEIHEKYLAHIDTIASYLNMLQDAGVVVLWRPYHEMNGGWFWWGEKSNFPKLWELMYDRFTNYHQLNNLIWVWSANLTFGHPSRELERYYPGNDWVDINGLDGYNDQTNWDVNSSDLKDLDDLIAFKENNPVAFTELGTLPDPDWLKEDRPEVSWFLCWWTHIVDNHTDAEIREVYDHPYTITRDELPALIHKGNIHFSLKGRVDEILQKSVQHYSNAIDLYDNYLNYPSSNDQDGNLKTVSASNWVSGFFPGCLWYMYEYTNDEKFRIAAQNWTAGLEAQQYNSGTHDLGFMMYCSYGNGYRLTSEDSYRDILIQAAETLNLRFNETVASIRSWDWGAWEFPVIIDNMMNLELLSWAGKSGGDSDLSGAAIMHANTTLNNHFREDFSSYHVVDYNPLDGSVIGKGTYQGFSDESAWARGQAWGLYGFTMMFRETGDSAYLNQAMGIADYIIGRLPDDFVPFWDFDAPDIPDEPKDASAAAITASALMELYELVPEKSKYYLATAEQIIENLASSYYFAEAGTNNNFLLKHSTGNKPSNGGVDVAQVYADYYFLEALLRYRSAGISLAETIPDLSLEEDGDPYLVSQDLKGFYGLDSEENLEITVQSISSYVDAQLSDAYALSLSYPENYNGNSRILVKISLDSMVAYDEFLVYVNPINDSPEAAGLISPANDAALSSTRVIFDWTDAFDIDGDTLSYDLIIRGVGLDTVFSNLTQSSFRLDGSTFFKGFSEYTWSVLTKDDMLVIESEIFSFLTPDISSVKALDVQVSVRAYPNPFSEVIFISFFLEADAQIGLQIFDNKGALIRSKLGRYLSGENVIEFYSESSLQAGTYIYTLNIDSGKDVKVLSGKLIKK